MSKTVFVLSLIASAGLGLVAGLHSTNQQAIAKGRLSACVDIVGVLNSSAPLALKCTLEKGIVYISSDLAPGKVTLDGKLVN